MDVAVGLDDLPILEEQLACMERECAADFVTGFIVESPEKLRRRLLWHFQALHGLRPFPPQRRASAPPKVAAPTAKNVRETGSSQPSGSNAYSLITVCTGSRPVITCRPSIATLPAPIAV